MQIRKTIKRHVADEVAADIASGSTLSDEQYAKMLTAALDENAAGRLGGMLDPPGAHGDTSDDNDDDGENFYDAPQDAVVDDLEDFYRDASVHDSPRPAFALGDPAPEALELDRVDGYPLVHDGVELDAPDGGLFSDRSSDPGHDEDEDEPAPLGAFEADASAHIPLEDVDESMFELGVHDPVYVRAEELFDPEAVDHEPPAANKLPTARGVID
ncbi:hypothetical protein C2E23DRAFT_856827 [Lenzites betulinus]|nr:hypothetical protein C2E23DRAFT_856827 [Lenzites betulinus]